MSMNKYTAAITDNADFRSVVNEEVEQLDELSKQTLASYANKATDRFMQHTDNKERSSAAYRDAERKIATMKRPTKAAKWKSADHAFDSLSHGMKAAKKKQGVETALRKIHTGNYTREEVDLDEVESKTLSYKDFMASLLEYEAKGGVYRHKGSYGSSYQGDDDDEKKPSQPTEKRGRGRPAGAKSGARGPRSK